MGLIKLKCSSCGDNMHVDDEKKEAFCPSCGVKNIITPDVNINYNQQTIHKTIIGKEKTEAEEYIANGNALLELCDFKGAKQAFNNAIDINAKDYRSWLGLAAAATKNYTNMSDPAFVNYHTNALKVATPEQKEEINRIIIPPEQIHAFGITHGQTSRYLLPATEVSIPSYINSIGEKTFENKTKLTSITISESVTHIGTLAFANCTGITEITIPDSVKSIDEYAFSDWTKAQTISVNKTNSKKWNKKWHKDCHAKILYR